MYRFWVIDPSDVSQPKGKRFEIEGGGLHFGMLGRNFLAFPRAYLCASPVQLIPPTTTATTTSVLPVMAIYQPTNRPVARPVAQKCCTIICIMLNRKALRPIDLSANRPTKRNTSEPIARM